MEELFIYIDPGFLDYIGHYRSFAENIHDDAERRGVETWHFVNTEVSDEAAGKYNLRRAFLYKAKLREGYYSEETFSRLFLETVTDRITVLSTFLKKSKLSVPALASFAGDIVTGYNALVLKSFTQVFESVMDEVLNSRYKKITIYMYTSHPMYFPVYGNVLNREKYSKLDVTAWLGLFYINTKFCAGMAVPKYKALLKECSEALEVADPDGKIKLCADSTRCIAKYAPFFRRDIMLFPIPLRNGQTVESVCSNGEDNASRINIGYFGYMDLKQGYHLMFGLYKEIIKDSVFNYVHFSIRHNFINDELIDVYGEFKKEMQRIKHLVGDMTKKDYEDRMSECDIIIIPYSTSEYQCRTSGAFVDALRQRKVVIVPDDSWMSDMMRQYGSGEVFRSDDLCSLVETVKKVCHNFRSYKSRTGRNIESFQKFHSSKTLLDMMNVG